MNRFAEISNALYDVYKLDEELGRRVYDTTNRVLASVESAIATHWIISVECNHARKTDKAACACGYVTWECKSVGEAVAAFAQHVMAVAHDDQKVAALAGGIAPPSAPPTEPAA